MVRSALIAICLLVVVAGGCHSGAPAAPGAVAANVKVFTIKGNVVSLDKEEGSVLLDHEAVVGYMEAMTMSYKLKDPAILGELHPGDRILAKLLVQKGEGHHAPLLDEIVVTAQARPDYKPSAQPHVPASGEAVPDFTLRNQSGKTIHLAQFQGRVLLVTFVYTRCPLADYCPRMSRNFAEIDKALAKDGGVYPKTHLLSISFDPAYDTPAVLTSYGGAYTGEYTKERFEHWDFAVPPVEELAEVTRWFGVGVTPGHGGSLQHSLSTVVIGKDGRVVAWYPTNDWTVHEALAEVRKAAA